MLIIGGQERMLHTPMRREDANPLRDTMASCASSQFPLFEAAAWEVEEDAKRGEYSGGCSRLSGERVCCATRLQQE